MPDFLRKRLEHDVPGWLRADHAIYFITICCRERGKNSLCQNEISESLLQTIRHRHEKGIWWTHLALLMPDHLHMLLSFPLNGPPMEQILKNWKSWTARTLKIQWQHGFFDHRLRKEESLVEKSEYILQNPVRAGLVAEASSWSHYWKPE